MKNWFWLFLVILSLACANQGLPPGGPVDKDPPRIVVDQVMPAVGAVRVPLDTDVTVLFSENVERKSVEDAFFISPIPHDGFRYKWKKKELTIQFNGTLLPERTYVITIGTGTRDLRKNNLMESFVLAFATGDSLDRGRISGQVYAGGKTTGIQIWAYSLTMNSAPNPRDVEADYVTQCDESGMYSLPYLAIEDYRLFAVSDKDVNRFYDPEYDEIGIATKDARLSVPKSSIENCNFRMMKEDTTGAGIFKIYPVNSRHLSVRFDEALGAINPDVNLKIEIQTVESRQSLAVHDAYLNPRDPGRLEVLTADQQETGYLLSVSGLVDVSGNPLDSRYNSIGFTGTTLPDTTAPKLVDFVPGDSTRNIALNQKLAFYFSEAIQLEKIAEQISVTDTNGTVLTGTFSPGKYSFVNFRPDTLWPTQSEVLVTLNSPDIQDLAGNSLADSVYQLRFSTLNADTLTAISGEVKDFRKTAGGPFYLTARSVEKPVQKYEIKTPRAGNYEFAAILPGRYVIEGYRDEDQNGKFSYGSVLPFVAAERFFVYPDTFQVKSRWPFEGHDFEVKE